MEKSKQEYITLFREKAEKIFSNLLTAKLKLSDKASEMNKQIKHEKELFLSKILNDAKQREWTNEKILKESLLITYASYIVMLEYRNEIWPYEYMSFARRIGELWEPFCKLAFEYPISKLNIVEPPIFSVIQEKIQIDAKSYIENLNLDEKIKKELKEKYDIPWKLVDSGGINMKLDLHFEKNGINYNCDFKSGFSSNEKGNTNRLLLVASIYNFLGGNNRQIIFVRQKESENNHYLQTLKNSKFWNVYCADECYSAIKEFTGFDLKVWMSQNINWEGDISLDFKNHLYDNSLLKYLTW